ncbi:helicase HerA-like domain-containing protein [Limnobacter litoralis]|uniref:ATP-binding protein n=1 Tax=Limnobacter litoralis TaxID=481366 RepID=A0ABQ5YXP8_9BURK|nr:helicase HerA-like domain-containing protein [Limnobacter litoralis]GLR27688.1 ATP-binding protein [Limnobacter litoralis]
MPSILIGGSDHPVELLGQFANRHGLIAGATGTGKTVTLQVLAESFSRMGVPVFMADVKGDLSGISQPGKPHPKVQERIDKIGITDFNFEGAPCIFWDLFGQSGHPVRTTISELGPTLLARLLDLNDTQEGLLAIAFRFADDQKLLMIDLHDLQTTLQYMADNANEFKRQYGNVSAASVGTIQRKLLELENAGADLFFGEPAIDFWDFFETDANGRGLVNILCADKLINSPKTYSTFLLWLMSELFENLPEVGDQEKPRFVLFFDEAHLLFNDAPNSLVEKIEQVVRLIRSKGVGIYFITQSPSDVPERVLGQLGNRVQHALRAFTPNDQKTVKVSAQTFRPNPKLDTEGEITRLGVGEALVSVLQADGTPSMVEKVLISPPHSQIGPIDTAQRQAVMSKSPFAGKYDQAVDPESAHEVLQARMNAQQQQAQAAQAEKLAQKQQGSTRQTQSVGEAFLKSMTRAMASKVGRELARGLLGSLLK